MNGACGVTNCGMPKKTCGYCQKHYMRWRRHGDANKVLLEYRPGLEVRRESFFKLITKGDSCWIWNGPMSDRYGVFAGQTAHRVAWQLAFGPIVKGLCVLHKCDVPRCVNPEHLFIGTQQDNIRDMVEKRRHGNLKKEKCLHGHDFETVTMRTGKVKRICRTCERQRAREVYWNRKVVFQDFLKRRP